MKLSKKFAYSVAALLAVSLAFTGCMTEDDEDPEGAISGSNKNYTVSYSNETDETYRCTNTTTFKHEGELVKITIANQTSSDEAGVMGFMWDLRQSKSVTGTAITASGYQNFFVVGARNNKGTIQYYISKFFNVSDLQADNFGVTSTTGTVSTHAQGIASTNPEELIVQDFTAITGASIDSDKNVTLWFDIYPVFSGSTYGVAYASHSSDAAGSYVVDIYDADPTSTTVTATKLTSVTIDTDKTGYTAEPTQGTLGVYANIYASCSLEGSWYLAKDYAADEVVEE